MGGRVQWEAQVDSNIKQLLGDAKQLRDELDGIKKRKYEVKLNIDEKKLENVISNLDKMLTSLGKGTGDFKEFENLSKLLNDIVSEVQTLNKAFNNTNATDALGNLLKDEESLKSITLLFQKIIEESNKIKNNELFNSEQLQELLSVFDKIENSLSSLRSIISDVGDGEEFSPLLKALNDIKEAASNIKLNFNMDLGDEVSERLNQKISQASARQLEAYRKLFSAMKGTKKTNKEMLKFFEPDEASVSELIGMYKGIIERAEKQFKVGNSNVYKKYLGAEYDTLKREITNANKQLSRADSKRSENGILGDLFGNTKDLSGVIEQLNKIIEKLDEISKSALDFKSTFKERFNVTASIEEIDKLTNRVKELEDELSKIKLNPVNVDKSNISSENITAIEQQIKKQNEYNDLVSVGYDRIQKMKKISESGTTGSNSVYDLLRLNHKAWDEVKANNFFNTIPEEGLQRYTKILEVVEKIVQEMVKASGLTESQIISQLKDIQTAKGGNFKLNGTDSGWTHFATYSNGQKDAMQKPNGITYKVYAAFDDIKDLNQNVVSSIMEELTKAGFKGRLKTTSGSTSFGDKLNGLAITDQMVVHGSTKKDQEIAYNVLKNIGVKLSYLGGGIDTPDGSFSQTLASGEINKYIQGLEKEAVAARDAAKAEQQLADSRKDSSVATPIKDVIQGDTDKLGMDEIVSSTEDAVQAKKDFASANEGVQLSIDGSKSHLQLEAELMSNIAESARKAADAKKEFVEANKDVKDGTDSSNNSLKKDKYKDKSKISEDDYTSRSDYFASIANKKLIDSGNTILGNSVNTELVDGLVKVNAKIKEADGTWKTFSAKIDADGNMFEQRFRTITKNVDKLDKELKDFELDSSPALSYGETLEKAKQIRESLNLGDEFTVKVDSNELVTITKKLDDVNSSAISVTQTFKSAQDAIDNFGKETSNIAEKTSVALKNIKEKKDNVSSNTQTKKDDAQSSVNKALKDQIDAWKKIQNIREKIAKSNNSDEINALNESKESYQKQYDATEKVLKANSDLYDKEAQLLKLEQIRLETNTKIAKYKGDTQETQLSSAEKSLNKFQSKLSSLKLKPDEEHRFPKYTEYINQLDNAIKEYSDHLTLLRNKQNNGGIITDKDIQDVETYENKITDLFQQIKKFSGGEKGYENISATKIAAQINKLLEDNTRMSKEAKEQIKAYYAEAASGKPTRPLKEIYNDALKVVQAEKEMGRGGKSFLSAIKEKMWYGAAGQIANMFGFYDIINYARQGIDTVRELDTAFTEMRKVSDETVNSLKNYQATTFDTADAVGTTAKQIQDSTADWLRLGESMNQAAESAKVSNILLNVSEFDSIDSATESLVAMSQAYQDLSKMDIVDVLNNIGNNYSISTDGLATALQKSASALKTAQNDLTESTALVTAGNAIVQNPDSVGAGIRTIALRLTGTEEAKANLEELGEETDDVITTTSKLRDTILSATKAATSDGKGFDILDANGNYKSTYEIMQGLADLYDTIVQKDKELGTNNLNLLLETIAGKNRSNIAASILQNGDMLRSVYQDAQNSEGSAEKELEAYLDSIDGKMAQLENRAQEFWSVLIDSNTIKNGIDGLKLLLEILTKIIDYAGMLPLIFGGTAIIGAVKNFDRSNDFVLYGCESIVA